jgi:hypothetical protein
VGLSLGVNNPPQTKAIDLPRHQSLKAETRYNSDNTPFQLVKLYNGTGGALVANRPYLITFAGTSTTVQNPQVTALAAQAGVQNHVVIAHEAVGIGEWGFFCYQGYHDCGIEGTTDVAAGDYLLVSDGVSTTGLVKDGTSRTQQSCAIACEAQATNSVVDKRVYLFGGPALTSLAAALSSVTLTAASSLTASANNATAARLTIENQTNGTAATANVLVKSPTSSGGVWAVGSSFATAGVADYVGLFAESTATGLILFLTDTTQNVRINANGGNIVTITGASPSVWTFQDATNFACGSTTGLKIGTATTQKLAFFNSTPVVQGTAYTQTFATADKTHAARTATALTVADGAGTNDGTIGAITADASVIAAVQELAAMVNALIVDVADTASVVNSVVDDLRTFGLVA